MSLEKSRPSVTGKLGVSLIQAFRDVDPRMSIQWVSAFLYVAAHPGCHIKDIAEHLEVADGAATMVCAGLGEEGINGREGKRLIKSSQDNLDYRAKQLHLSTAGRRLLERIEVAHRHSCKELA